MSPIARKGQSWGLNACLSEEPRPLSSGLPFAWSVTSGTLLVTTASFWEIRYNAVLPNNGLEASFQKLRTAHLDLSNHFLLQFWALGNLMCAFFKIMTCGVLETKWTNKPLGGIFFFLMPLLWELTRVLWWQTYIIVVTCFWDTEDENRNKIWTFQVSTWVTYINDREKWSWEKEF